MARDAVTLCVLLWARAGQRDTAIARTDVLRATLL